MLCLATLLTGCRWNTRLEDLTDPAQTAAAEGYFDHLRQGEFYVVMRDLDPQLLRQGVDREFATMRAAFPDGDGIQRKLVGYWRFMGARTNTLYDITYEFGNRGRWALANVVFEALPDGRRRIKALSVASQPASLEAINAFTLRDKGPVHYFFLAACAGNALFTLATFACALFTRFRRRKFRWLLFVLLGVGGFSLNWTTGKATFHPLHWLLFGAGCFRSGTYEPWTLAFAIPWGAVLFWVKRRSLTRERAPADAVSPAIGMTEPGASETSPPPAPHPH